MPSPRRCRIAIGSLSLTAPGLGYTDPIHPGGASIVEQATLLAKAAQQLGADAPIVMGQSYGGAVALAWGVHHPTSLSGLVLVSSPSNPWDTPLDPLYRMNSSVLGQVLTVPLLAATVTQERVDSTLDAVFAPQAVPEGYTDYMAIPLSLRRGALRATAMQRANLLAVIKTLQPQYGQISVPTEILHGDVDTIVGQSIHSDKLVTQIDGAVLTSLPGMGHMPHQVATATVVDAIDRAVARAGLR